MSIKKEYLNKILLISIFILGVFLRFYKIDFGLPHSYTADETDIYDQAIKYALNYKGIIANKQFEEFEPNSYVYGMFPTYFLTFSTIFLNKTASILNFNIDFGFYLIYMRIITALISTLIILANMFLYKLIFDKDRGNLFLILLTALNWKLIQHAHYLNQDIFLTFLLILSLIFYILYLKKPDKKYIHLFTSAIFMGLGFGTKITALIFLPSILISLVLKKRFKEIIFYFLGIILSFSISNPFSVINLDSFLSRILYMNEKEAGVVLSSVNNDMFKYAFAASDALTFPVLLLSILGFHFATKKYTKNWKENLENNNFHVHFILGFNVLLLIAFFSLSSRLVYRWLLPIIPILLIYAANSISYYEKIRKKFLKLDVKLIISLAVIATLVNSYSIYKQLEIGKPKALAYEWAEKNIKIPENLEKKEKIILVYTNEGRDPFMKMKNTEVVMFKVYEVEKAFNAYPKDPRYYEYIVLYSDMRGNYSNKYVIENYPDYADAWINFEQTISNADKFELLKKFETTDKNLLNTPEISVYRNLNM